jgi:hypothetical protein
LKPVSPEYRARSLTSKAIAGSLTGLQLYSKISPFSIKQT